MIVYGDGLSLPTNVLGNVFMDSDGLLRYATASENLPRGTIKYYSYRSGSSSTEVVNPAGRYYYQPSITAPGVPAHAPIAGENRVEVLSSLHFSPNIHYVPSVTKNSSGTVTTNGYCDYVGNILIPYEYYDSSYPAMHNVSHTGFMVSYETSPDGDRRTNVSSSPSANRPINPSDPYDSPHAYVKAVSWFMLLVDGTVGFPNYPIRYLVKCAQKAIGYPVEECVCSQVASATVMMESGRTKYYLIQTNGIQPLMQSTPVYPPAPERLYNFEYVDQAQLAIDLSNNTTVSLTGWGHHVWVENFA